MSRVILKSSLTFGTSTTLVYQLWHVHVVHLVHYTTVITLWRLISRNTSLTFLAFYTQTSTMHIPYLPINYCDDHFIPHNYCHLMTVPVTLWWLQFVYSSSNVWRSFTLQLAMSVYLPLKPRRFRNYIRHDGDLSTKANLWSGDSRGGSGQVHDRLPLNRTNVSHRSVETIAPAPSIVASRYSGALCRMQVHHRRWRQSTDWHCHHLKLPFHNSTVWGGA